MLGVWTPAWCPAPGRHPQGRPPWIVVYSTQTTSQDFNGDIALMACFASSWTAAMVRRWHVDPFGFLRP
jgi:hypothetical protein